MREFVGLSYIANFVSMMRAEVDGALWLVDDGAEEPFYERIRHESGRVVDASDRASAALDVVRSRGIQGIVAAVRGWSSERPLPMDVFRPSLGDVASLLLVSPTATQVLEVVGGGPWSRACARCGCNLASRAAAVVRFRDSLREIKMRVPRSGRGVPVAKDWFVDWTSFTVRWEGLFRRHGALIGREDELRAAWAALLNRPLPELLGEIDGWEVVMMLSLATQNFRPRGICSKRCLDGKDLFDELLLGYQLEQLEADDIFWQMRRWERLNSGYPLLRSWRANDPLGVVWGQQYWQKDLESMLRSLRPGENLAAFKLDLDNFKKVNEALGHLGGDEALKVFLSVVKGVFTGQGEVYRRGGDEVIVLAPGLDLLGASALAEELRSRVETELRAWGSAQGLAACPTASIGVVVLPSDCGHMEASRLMDKAQLEAKHAGKNRVVVAVPANGHLPSSDA